MSQGFGCMSLSAWSPLPSKGLKKRMGSPYTWTCNWCLCEGRESPQKSCWFAILLMVQKSGDHQLILALVGSLPTVYPIRGYIPGGWPWDFWTINSRVYIILSWHFCLIETWDRRTAGNWNPNNIKNLGSVSWSSSSRHPPVIPKQGVFRTKVEPQKMWVRGFIHTDPHVWYDWKSKVWLKTHQSIQFKYRWFTFGVKCWLHVYLGMRWFTLLEWLYTGTKGHGLNHQGMCLIPSTYMLGSKDLIGIRIIFIMDTWRIIPVSK